MISGRFGRFASAATLGPVSLFGDVNRPRFNAKHIDSIHEKQDA